ncbi:MAG: hypothetical protein V5A47_12190 [Bacteroidales bacterium]
MKGIVFYEDYIKAALEGKKTRHRILMDKQPEYIGNGCYEWVMKDNQPVVFKKYPMKGHLEQAVKKPCSAGEYLFIKERWAETEDGIIYKAENPDLTNEKAKEISVDGKGWRTPVHMTKKKSRIQIYVDSIGVDRLLNITENEAAKEGVQPESIEIPGVGVRPSYKQGFLKRWKDVYGDKGGENPFIWVIELRVVKTENE